jgi:hypothetical protein
VLEICCGATKLIEVVDGKSVPRKRWFFVFVLAAMATRAVAGDEPRAPAELYKTYCSGCHEGGVPRAPHSINFPMIGPAAILGALESGAMRAQGSALTFRRAALAGRIPGWRVARRE